jgi:hypothetical protein
LNNHYLLLSEEAHGNVKCPYIWIGAGMNLSRPSIYVDGFKAEKRGEMVKAEN